MLSRFTFHAQADYYPCRLLFSLLLYRLTSYWNFLAFRCMIVELFRSHTCKESPHG